MTPGVPVGPGTVLGRYRLEERVGEGGFATVWRARDPVLLRDVAVKVPRQAWWTDDEVLAEARALARLAHPFIVQVLDAGTGPTGPFFVLEHVEGDDVETVLGRLRRHVAPRVALALLEGPAAALDHAHAMGVLHRDVNPANLLVGADVAQRLREDAPSGPLPCKLTDFGLAELARRGARGPAACGVPGYAAPEAWRGQADASSDVMSLAAVFFRLVAGRPPLPGATPAEQVAAAGRPERIRLAETRPDLPRALDETLAAALSPRRHERPRTAGALLASLRAALSREQEVRLAVAEARERIDARRKTGRSTCGACLRPLHPRAESCPACGEPVGE